MGERDFIAGYNAAWDDSGEGHNGEYTRPSFTHERYAARRSEAYAEHVASGEAEPTTARETSASIAQWQNETFGDVGAIGWHDVMSSAVAVTRLANDLNMLAARMSGAGEVRPNLSRALRAFKEFDELIRTLMVDDADHKACEEVADVSIVLDGILGAHGKELEDERAAKMAINRARKWELTGDGHGQHVKEDE